MELQAWFWGQLLLKFLCFIPVACPLIKSLMNTQGSGITQATNSSNQPYGIVEDTRSMQVSTIEARTIQTGRTIESIEAIRTFNITRIRPTKLRQSDKPIYNDRTVHPAINTRITRGRL